MGSTTFTEEAAGASPKQHRPRYYPVYLDLQGRRCVVIGTGPEVERKVQGLLEAGAGVVVIWPTPSPGLEALADSGSIALIRRPYREGDLTGAFLAIAATTADRPLSERIATVAHNGGILLNVMDVTDLCGWIAPAIVRRGHLSVAVSTDGLSPALTRFIKEKFEQELPEEYGTLLEVLAKVRAELRRRRVRPRPEKWQEALNSQTLGTLVAGDRDRAYARLLELLDPPSQQSAATPQPRSRP